MMTLGEIGLVLLGIFAAFVLVVLKNTIWISITEAWRDRRRS